MSTSKILPCLFRVSSDLPGQGLHGGEPPFPSLESVELHAHLVAVQVAVKVQDEALHRHPAVIVGHSGAYAHIGNGGAALAIEPHPGGVDPEGGDNHPLRKGQVHRGKAQGGAQTLAVAHRRGELERVAQEISGGNVKNEITYESKDELGVLADSFRRTCTALTAVIGDLSYLMDEMARGNFDIRTRAEEYYVNDFKPILLSIREMNRNLSGTLIRINEASEQVASGSDQVSSGAQGLSQGATEQASAVEQLAASIAEISDQVKKTSENAKLASEQVENAGADLTLSNQKMQEMIGAMSEISERSGEIGKIIKTIEDIAFQTNILALNAAVEAARAGSAGKGFAVVADEVRNLASKSAEAAKNTTVLIEGSMQAVENGTRIADSTAKALLSTVESTKNAVELVSKITLAAEQQANSIQEINQGVDQISSVVQTNSATAQESAAASEELSGQSQMLKELTGRFRLRMD